MPTSKQSETTRWRFPNGQEVTIAGRWYAASCDHCGWCGSSEECGEDVGPVDDSDVYCPKCNRAGADHGALGEAAEKVA